MPRMYDVVVIGGGPAGLSAALVLGRSRRRTLVCDAGEPRNAVAPAAHSFFTRDGTPPGELVAIGRAQLAPYDVELQMVAVKQAEMIDRSFVLTLATGEQVGARQLLLATGMRDMLPAIDNIEQFWGQSVLLCPYCHGWEVRDEPFALLANAEEAAEFAMVVRSWSRDLVLCTAGATPLDAATRARMVALGVPIFDQPIVRLEGAGGQLRRLHFADGTSLERRVLFLRPAQVQRSDLASALGCQLDADGYVVVDEQGQTSVAGVYAAGDMTHRFHQIALAVAQSARAAIAINHSLILEDVHLPAWPQ